MRKTPTLALGLLASAALTGGAVAQAPAPSHTVQIGVTPSKAGTKAKPKAVSKFKLSISNDRAAGTTASRIEISFPKTIRINTKGFTTCPLATLESEDGVKGCSAKSRLGGKGTATAVLNPTAAAPTPLEFETTFVVGAPKTLYVFLQQTNGDRLIAQPLVGKVSRAGGKYGEKLTITIPENVQQPNEGLYSALSDIENTLRGTAGTGSRKHSILESIGCTGGRYDFRTKLTYAPNPNPPAATTSTATDTVSCSK